MNPNPDCEKCGGTGRIDVPDKSENAPYRFTSIDCPECEEVKDTKNEQVTK